jgi:hypothetical protein
VLRTAGRETAGAEWEGGREREAASSRPGPWRLSSRLVMAAALIVVAAAAVVDIGRHHQSAPHLPHSIVLPVTPHSYLGLYQRATTSSYAGVNQFAQATGRQPNIVTCYNSWGEPFQAGFAVAAANHGAVPLVQMNPEHISLAAIVSGRYDGYLKKFAVAVRSYQRAVIIGFGHEMNGDWYSWGFHHTSPATFVAAWRHVVTVFRAHGAWNVTWLWTVNVIDSAEKVPAPGPWWPGSAYVTWVGIDGYYFQRSWSFAPLFGPTIKAVHTLTHDPILISETGAGRIAGQAAKIRNLFAGVRAYGLLGFVWFDSVAIQDWRLRSASSLAAFRREARTFSVPGS